MDKIAEQLEISVRNVVEQFWPKLVAAELMQLEKSGSAIEARRGRSREATRDLVVQLKADGRTTTEISQLAGIGAPYIYVLLGEAKQSAKPKNPKKSRKTVAAKRVTKTKMSLAKALEKYGSKAAAARALKMAESTFRDRLAMEQIS